MIPSEVENRIARYFMHMYLPDEVGWQLKKDYYLLHWNEEENLDQDELVRWAIEIIDKQIGDKRIR
jgi:hypothetical protein